MVKALTFKGDKKASKKRKRDRSEQGEDAEEPNQPRLSTQTATETDDETWVSADALSDIAGPVLLVLPTRPVTCVATDAMGKVHSSPIENMIEDAPSTAEPHLVSQVWIAARVLGSDDEFTFKGHHSRYLGCDKIGFCSATDEAVSPEETFKLSLSTEEPECFDIRTSRGRFLSVDSQGPQPRIRGDVEEASSMTKIRIRMQSRFKPQHQRDKAEKVRSKISRKELEAAVGRRLDDDEVRMLKKARKEGTYHEAMLDVKVKGKHDKYA